MGGWGDEGVWVCGMRVCGCGSVAVGRASPGVCGACAANNKDKALSMVLGKKALMMVLTVDIHGGGSGDIKVSQDDDPEELADAFIAEHHLVADTMLSSGVKLRESLVTLIRECRGSSANAVGFVPLTRSRLCCHVQNKTRRRWRGAWAVARSPPYLRTTTSRRVV